MLYLDDLKYMKLYKKRFLAPIERKDKLHGSAILLLTPNYDTSLSLMKYDFMDNRRRFHSYYIEKDIMYTINSSSKLECTHYDNSLMAINESVENAFIETTDISLYDSDKPSEYINELYYKNGNTVIFFNELYDDEVYNEATYDNKYKRLLYNDRIRNNKTMIELYKKVKEDAKNMNLKIDKTFLDLKRYNGLNLFVDLYYYNQAYLRNNRYTMIKSIDMYFEFIKRFIYDRRIDKAGYSKKTIFLPIEGWDIKEDTKIIDFKSNLNPLAVIYKKLRYSMEDISSLGNLDFIIMGKNGYFKFNASKIDKSNRVESYMKFERFIRTLQDSQPIIDDSDEPDNSANATADEIIDSIELANNIEIHDLTGNTNSEDEKDRAKAELVKKINDVSKKTTNVNDAIDTLDQDEEVSKYANIILDVQDSGPKMSAARTNRFVKNNEKFLNSSINNKSIRRLIENGNKLQELPESSLPIKTINDEWHHLKAVNFEKEYDLDADIMSILYSLQNTSYPISVLSAEVEDTSTSEDSIYTYTVKCEDYNGKRFTLKFDIPKFRDNRFMRLRGNEKVFSAELPLIPISKTDPDTVQIVSFYNKIFIERYYTSSGKSTNTVSKLMRYLAKNERKDISFILGDNSAICDKYELPVDYIDLCGTYNTISNSTNGVTIFFNQDSLRSTYDVDPSKGIPYGYNSKTKQVLYYNATEEDAPKSIAEAITKALNLTTEVESIKDINKSTYSRASILNTDIPVIVILAYNLGLINALDKARIDYDISEKKNNDYDRHIKLANGYINYRDSYTTSMIINGLTEVDMASINIEELNSKSTWIDVLDNFGGRIKADGLDNFNDLMYDPITVRVSADYNLPTDYNEALIYASNLLIDNKYTKHIDLSTNRYRTNEVIAAQFYRVLSSSYKDYALQQKNGRSVAMSMKQSAVIDLILQQNTTSDLSVFQPLLEIESKNMISTKGVTGMNSDRAYRTDKRGYDDSMINILAQATGFASTVGVNRQTTIDPNISSGRGYINQSSTDDLSVTKSACMTEALSPFVVSSDDPFRSFMTFTQTAKHTTPIKYGSPMLITTGADAALPYLCSDMFAFKAKYNGKVIEKTDEYMVVEYANKTKEFINLSEQTMKNSDGGFYITLQLVTDLKQGSSFKKDQILAYDKASFSNNIAAPQLTYNNGVLAKVCIATTEDGFEDSGVCSEWLAEAMESDIVVMKSIALEPMANIYFIASKGQNITEGDPVLIFQNAYDEEDANLLMKNLNNEDGDVIEIGRSVIKSKVTGTIADIKIYRTCELEECSESLQKIIKSNNASINKLKRVASKCNNEVQFDSTDTLPKNGKLKNVNGVLIEIYMKYTDRISIGDKGVLTNANKCIYRNIYPDSEAPYTDFRPNEAIDQITSASSMDGRIITSIMKTGAANKLMIELYRKVCDIMGVKWYDLHELKEVIESKKK